MTAVLPELRAPAAPGPLVLPHHVWLDAATRMVHDRGAGMSTRCYLPLSEHFVTVAWSNVWRYSPRWCGDGCWTGFPRCVCGAAGGLCADHVICDETAFKRRSDV